MMVRPSLLELVDQVPQMPPRLRIEPGGRLIEKQQLGIAHQRAGHGQPLLLAAREAADARTRASLPVARSGSILRPRCRAGKNCGTAAASPPPSACRETASPGAECRCAAGARSAPVPQFRPSSSTVPSSGTVSPSQISMVVVFPAPFGPSSPKHSPRATSRSSPSTACTSAKPS